MAHPETKNPDRLSYSERELDAHGILSRTTRWRLRRKGRFPYPRPIGGRHLYIGAEIREWLLDPEGWAQVRPRTGVTNTPNGRGGTP